MADPIVLIDDTGVERFLGNIVPDPNTTRLMAPVYGDKRDTPMIPRSEWEKYAIPMERAVKLPHLTHVHNQQNVGMCNYSATASAGETIRIKQGLSRVELSAGYGYGKISGGTDRGSMLEDGIRDFMENGCCTIDTIPYMEWRRRTREAEVEAKKYRCLEAFLCPTFDHCVSAVIAGYELIIGIMWYPNFTPGSDGRLPSSGRGNPGGHALHVHSLTWIDGKPYLVPKNSWSPQWGYRGHCAIGEPLFDGPVGGWWCVRSMVDEGGIVPQEEG